MDINRTNGGFVVTCTRDELSILSNALNNIPQAVSAQDYGSLIGADKQHVDALLDEMVAALTK